MTKLLIARSMWCDAEAVGPDKQACSCRPARSPRRFRITAQKEKYGRLFVCSDSWSREGAVSVLRLRQIWSSSNTLISGLRRHVFSSVNAVRISLELSLIGCVTFTKGFNFSITRASFPIIDKALALFEMLVQCPRPFAVSYGKEF